MSPYTAVELIRAKRDGRPLDDAAIEWLISAFTNGEVADEQMAAMAMAIFFRGLDDRELACWTRAMIATGSRMDFSSLTRPTVDKHSTGGVGDKITLPLAPLLAACGAAVPQLSGRGLGHTGGTLDKLESIPGWRAQLSTAQLLAQLDDVGAVICAAGSGLAPADKRLYALRDVTGTVESIPLIASSIMSKKIAEGADALVLDVKAGSGAFMKNLEDARQLATRMVELGSAAGVRTVALLTDMNTPLGCTVGNALEVREAIEVLAGGGPSDVVGLTVALANEMVSLAGLNADPADVLANGQAMDTWRRMIRAQGGEVDAPLPTARFTDEFTAATAGIVTTMDAMAIGTASWRLGAGRARRNDAVQAAAGIELLVRPGDRVAAGTPLLRLHTDTAEAFGPAREALGSAITIGIEAPIVRPLVIDRIG